MSTQEQAAAAKKRGNGHYAKKDWSEAIAEYTAAIELYDGDHSYFSNRSACYAATDQFEEALADGQKCVALKPDWAKGYGRVGYALFKLDKLEEATKAYEDGLAIDGGNATLKDGLAECKKAQGGGGGGGGGLFGPKIWQTISLDPELRPLMSDKDFVSKINMLNANPQMAMQMGVLNDPKVKKVFEKMMGMKMDFGGSGSGSGSADEKEKEKEESTPEVEVEVVEPEAEAEAEPELSAEEFAERAAKRDNEANALSLKAEGNALYKAKDYDAAIAKYRLAQQCVSDNAAFVVNESAALFMQQKWDATLECCSRAIAVNQSALGPLKWSFKAYQRMGSVEQRRGDSVAAIAWYKKALVEQGDAKVRSLVRKLERAHEKHEREAMLDPELAVKLKAEGNALFGQGQFAHAITKYTEALKRNPSDHKIYSNRATCFCKLMRWDAALSDCDEAIKLDATFIKAYIRKGKVNHCLKQYHKALQAYKEAEAIDATVEDLVTAKRDTMMAIQRRNMEGPIPEEDKKRALQDPDVQSAMNDPEVSSVLLQAQSGDPTILYKAMRDRPHIKDKIEYLMAAGVLRLG